MPAETKEVEQPNTELKDGSEGNDFGAAFEEAAIGKPLDEKAAETQVNKDEGAVKDGKEPEAGKTDEGVKDEKPEVKLPEPGAKKEVENEEVTLETLKHKHNTLQGMYEKDTKDLQAKIKDLEEKVSKKADTPAPEKPDEGKLAEEMIDKMIEETPALKDFFEEYDVMKGPMKMLIGMAISKSKAGGSDNAEAVNSALANLHRVTITTAHKDFDDLIKVEGEGKPSKLETFVKGYTGSDKGKIEHAFYKGDASEVIELIDRYKESVKEIEAKAANSEVSDEVKEQREKKLKDLVAVSKKDAAVNVNTKAKATTFSDGFKEAAGG